MKVENEMSLLENSQKTDDQHGGNIAQTFEIHPGIQLEPEQVFCLVRARSRGAVRDAASAPSVIPR